jgi:hypothetical protein
MSGAWSRGQQGTTAAPSGQLCSGLDQRRRLGPAAFTRACRIWHARGQGFKSPQLHSRSEGLSGLDRPRIARPRQQIGSNRRRAGRSVAHQSVTPAMLASVVSWSDLPNAITRCREAIRGFEASASGPGGRPRPDVVRTQHGSAPRPGLARVQSACRRLRCSRSSPVRDRIGRQGMA